MAYQQATSGGHLTKDYTIKEAGYAYLYISNEQTYQTDVYFDDVVMSYTPTNVIQSNEYYPFGLQAANSWTRDNTTNNFLYDAGNELNTTSGFYDLPYRNYDAALGRFFQIDPLAHRSHNLTAYHYAGNNPIGSNDPSGLMVPYYAPGQNPMIRHNTDYMGNHLDFDGHWGDDYGSGGGGNSYYSGSGIDGAVSSKTPGDYSTYTDEDLKTEVHYGNQGAASYASSTAAGPMVAVPDGNGGTEYVSAIEILSCHCEQNHGRIDQALDAIAYWRGGSAGGGDNDNRDLIRKYEDNQSNGLAMLALGYGMAEAGVGGDLLAKARRAASSLVNPDRTRQVNDVLNRVKILVDEVKSMIGQPASRVAELTFSLISATEIVMGSSLLYYNEKVLAPQILEADPSYYNSNIASFHGPLFGGAGANGKY